MLDNAADCRYRSSSPINCYARSNGLIKNCYACSPVVKCDLLRHFAVMCIVPICGVIIKMRL